MTNEAWAYYWLLVLGTLAIIVLSMTGCTKVLQGPETNLEEVAVPKPLPEVVTPKPPPGPSVSGDVFRAWEPGTTTANGDSRSGRWITLSTTPPELEVLKPAKPMPRMPRHAPPTKPTAGAAPARERTSPAPTPSPSSGMSGQPPRLPSTPPSALQGGQPW